MQYRLCFIWNSIVNCSCMQIISFVITNDLLSINQPDYQAPLIRFNCCEEIDLNFMTQTSPNSYLQRYELKQQSKDKPSLSKSLSKGPASVPAAQQQPNTIGGVVGRLSQRVDGIEVKLTSLVNVVKLLQRYTQTRDDQYQKEKEQLVYKRQGSSQSCSTHCSLIQFKVKEFDVISKQFREELKNIEKVKQNLVLADLNFDRDSRQEGRLQTTQDVTRLQERLRDELNNKMQICVKLINSAAVQKADKGMAERLNELSFSLNQLQNESRRNKMMLEKEIDGLMALVKQTSTALPHNVSVNTDHNRSKSPLRQAQKSKSKNSKSDKSLSRGKQNRSALTIHPPKQGSKVRDEQLREALRKKKEHRERLKVKNW